MNEKFFDLKKEKQDRMINASLKAFALGGYLHASTDDIVRDAGISKGLLFHYFGSKLGLYSFLYDYSVRFFTLEVDSEIDRNESNLFALYRQFLTARASSMRQYPYMQRFLLSVETERMTEAVQAVQERHTVLHNMYTGIMKKGDISRFIDAADYERIGFMLDYVMERLLIFGEGTGEGITGADQFLSAAGKYIDMMEKLTYR
ncbi:MAG: TetR/AcrR family transcriptional regulator [Butyrivibrio sp.]|jgi:AcrR family transcriptional regulator|nr:TetR/AcrR family transcriptional regulator [Butyrivibrio sp.]